jgi:hypothetical protein
VAQNCMPHLLCVVKETVFFIRQHLTKFRLSNLLKTSSCTQFGYCCDCQLLICSDFSLSYSFFLGRGYIRARTDSTQRNRICLDIHRQTCVASFNLTCLSRLLTTKVLLVLSVHIGSDAKGTITFLMMTRMNFC